MEEQKGLSLDNVMIGVYLDIMRVSTSLLCSSQFNFFIFFIFMQLLHDVMTMRVVITKYANLGNTWKSWLKEADDRMAGCNHRLKEVAKWEAKLEELVTLRNLYDATLRELEA